MDVWHWQNCVSNEPELFSDTNERPIEFYIQDTEKTLEPVNLQEYQSDWWYWHNAVQGLLDPIYYVAW